MIVIVRADSLTINGHGRLSCPCGTPYNPIERCWGILETHWNEALLDVLTAVCAFTATMTWTGAHPVVAVVTTPDQTGVTLTKNALAAVEAHLLRLPHLDK